MIKILISALFVFCLITEAAAEVKDDILTTHNMEFDRDYTLSQAQNDKRTVIITDRSDVLTDGRNIYLRPPP